MPKYKPKPVNKPALIGLLLLTATIVIYQPIYLAIIAGIALLALAWNHFEEPKIEKYFAELCEERKDLSICDFARGFDSRSVDTWVIRAVYEQLQAALATKQNVPIKASDNLFDTLKLDEDDFDLDLVEEVAQRTGRSIENFQSNPYYGKVTTARNLVLFFNHQACVNAI